MNEPIFIIAYRKTIGGPTSSMLSTFITVIHFTVAQERSYRRRLNSLESDQKVMIVFAGLSLPGVKRRSSK